MGRGNNLLFNPPIPTKRQKAGPPPGLFTDPFLFSLPAQARDIFPGKNHLLLTDARNHLLSFHEEDGGYSLNDYGHLGAYAEAGNYASGNFAALAEEDGLVSLLFAPEAWTDESQSLGLFKSPTHLGAGLGSYKLQATSDGAYVFDDNSKKIYSFSWLLPEDWGGEPIVSEEEEGVLTFSPGSDGALYFQKYKAGLLKPRYLDRQGKDFSLGDNWQEEIFVHNSLVHTRQNHKVYFTYQAVGKGQKAYPLYWSNLKGKGVERVTYLRGRARRLEARGDSLLVFYENGELDVLESGTLMAQERLPDGDDHLMIGNTLLFLPRESHRKTFALAPLNEEESAKQGLRLGA